MRNFLLFTIFFILSFTVYPQASPEQLIRKGVSLHDKGKYREAISAYEEALKINPNSMPATYEMALTYLHLKEHDNALRYSTKVINANYLPLLVDAYCVKSSALAELGKYDDSINLLYEGLKRCGEEYLLHYNLGLSFFRKKDLRSAIIHLSKAIETDTTHPSSFLLYAYAQNDSDMWIQSFFAFHFFLLLEPNTSRSKDAFTEMYDILISEPEPTSPRLYPEDGIDRKMLYEFIKQNKPESDNPETHFVFFVEVTRKIILTLGQMQNDSRRGLLWDFFVPIYTEILGSGYMDVYCRYISVSYFPASLEWWNNNTDKVDRFISWFEEGQGEPTTMDEYGEYGDEED